MESYCCEFLSFKFLGFWFYISGQYGLSLAATLTKRLLTCLITIHSISLLKLCCFHYFLLFEHIPDRGREVKPGVFKVLCDSCSNCCLCEGTV